MSATPVMPAEQSAFLAAIADDPDNDTPRLAYADWLDEREPVYVPCRVCRGTGKMLYGGRGDGDRYRAPHESPCRHCRGSGTVPDTANAARAEFIRVQVGLARVPKQFCEYECKNRQDYRCGWCLLKDRESALRREHEARWRAAGPCPTCGGCGKLGRQVSRTVRDVDADCPACRGTGDAGGLTELSRAGDARAKSPWKYPVHFRRGFIHRVDCPRLADVMRQVEVSEFTDAGEVVTHEWEPTALAKAWLTATPERALVCEVVPLDRAPTVYADVPAYWHRHHDGAWSEADPGDVLPGALFDLVEGGESGGYYFVVKKHSDWRFPTPEAAVSALGRALCAWARNFK